jgi:3' terminal RNA ribose 2'-O-methyltransferase Hen1
VLDAASLDAASLDREDAPMLLTLTCAAPQAARFGYLLGKHPDSVFERPFSMGRVTVFTPEVADDRLTVAMLIEVDPVGLVRRPAPFTGLDQYVNDRPYVASSFTSVALNVAFSSALAGKCPQHPELVEERVHWAVHLPAVACEAGAELIRHLFAPLGYEVTTSRLPLDSHFPAWGEADLYDVRLAGEQTGPDVLRHLYILLPVLDNSKHYYISEDEIEKLMDHGGAWLSGHPERELITRRYLRYKRPLVTPALALLAAKEDTAPPAEEDAAPAPEEVTERKLGLHAQRLAMVMEAVRAAEATSLADLGCGEGRLLSLALQERSLRRILGIDVSSYALSRARRRLHLETLPPAQQARIQVAQGSLLYRDRRLEGFDVAALVEVIEHLDAPRLAAMEHVVFAHACPRRVIVTTPNREYNVRWESLPTGKLRHPDHRFEWTREEGRAWAARVAATHSYCFTWSDLGPVDDALGGPSQMLVFDRVEDATP